MKFKTPSYQSPSSFPHFHPHITLTTVPSSTPVETLRQAVPASQAAIPITFKVVEVGNKYFMSVYVTVHQDGALGELREHLKSTLGDKTVPPKSHVSLFYSDDPDVEERQKVYDGLVRQQRIVSLGEGRVGLDCSGLGVSSVGVWNRYIPAILNLCPRDRLQALPRGQVPGTFAD